MLRIEKTIVEFNCDFDFNAANSWIFIMKRSLRWMKLAETAEVAESAGRSSRNSSDLFVFIIFVYCISNYYFSIQPFYVVYVVFKDFGR